MKERPILFSGAMVRAILEGRKTQTRRVVKQQPQPDGGRGLHPVAPHLNEHGNWAWVLAATGHGTGGDIFSCPYGQPRDRLWVRETWKLEQYGGTRRPEILYRADMDDESAARWAPWRPSIFMKRGASRLTLEVTDVRVQRLQEISEEDARAEGVEASIDRIDGHYTVTAREQFETLWESINGERPGCSWQDNPWVWCVSFRRLP